MLNKIRLMLEYGCYPVWLYDENDELIDTLLPEEIRGSSELDSMFDDLQARFESLFINNQNEFSYVGFSTAEDKLQFLNDWNKAVKELIQCLNERYTIVDEISKVFN